MGQQLFVLYGEQGMWHERILLADLEVEGCDCWMILTPDMDCYAGDLNYNFGVRTAAAGNQVPRWIPRGRAYRFDEDFPTDGEFEVYQ